MSAWIILRMAASSTLSVAEGLTEAGFDVWTPTEKLPKREGPARKRVKESLPMMPTFVFARDDRLGELLALSMSPALTYQAWDAELKRMVVRGVPFFRLFRFMDGFPRIADRHLDPLRQAEQSLRPREKGGPRFPAGAQVRCPDAGFDGLVGTIQHIRGRYAFVAFPGLTIDVQIEDDRLLPLQDAA